MVVAAIGTVSMVVRVFVALCTTVAVCVLMIVFMRVAMIVSVPARAVGAALGFEGLLCLDHGQVHGAQHVGQRVVGFDLQVVGLELDGQVAVAQVVGRA